MRKLKIKKRILCFGDSNTHGYDALKDGRFSEEERYTCLLGNYLGADYTVIEEGLSGRTTVFDDPITEGLSGLSYLYPCLMTHEPLDLLIIMLGTNDVKERFSATPANIGKGMIRLVKKALAAPEAFRDAPNVLIVAPPPIAPGYDKAIFAQEMGKDCDTKARALAAEYKQAAELLHCHFLDAGTIPGVVMTELDRMHLTAEAHDALARKLADIIPTLL